MNSASNIARINFDKIDINQIDRILKTGSIESLTKAEQEYYKYMELVRGLRARMMLPGGAKVVSKAGIIKILKEQHGFSDWGARRLYDDTINFFYSESGIAAKAWRNLYAEKLEKMADLAFSSGKLKEARGLMSDAAKLRGCFDETGPEIPEELLNQSPVVVYTTDAAALGAPAADRKEVEEFIDALPDVPELVRDRVKEDAGVKKKNLLKRFFDDAKEFAEETE